MKTKKVGVAGRFGARYGKRVGANFAEVEKFKRMKWACPRCLKDGVKRESAGVWHCPACGQRFAGKAYKPK